MNPAIEMTFSFRDVERSKENKQINTNRMYDATKNYDIFEKRTKKLHDLLCN